MDASQVKTVIANAIIKARPALAGTPEPDVLQTTLRDLALDSLDATTLSLDIEDALGIVVEPEDLAICETLSHLVALVLTKT